MTLSDEQLALLDKELRRDEGVRNTMYKDSKGIDTIGVGHNCEVRPLPADWTQPLSGAQIDQLLNEDLEEVFKDLDDAFPWWETLDDVRKRCLANMTFNMGIETLMEFHNTMRDFQRGSYESVAARLRLSLWFKQVGPRAVRICDAIETGVMPE